MPGSSAWKTLQTRSPDLPRLLLKAHFDDNGYIIQLSDLSRIWTQTLQRHEIVAQAKRYRCSVDPSEDDAQYDILLGKIRTALNQESGTSLSLTPTEDGKINLITTAPLPKPLPELDWTFTLERAPDSHVEVELVAPFLQQANHLKQQMQRLIAELQAKDKVISKIIDRLDQSGHDLAVVFPNVSTARYSKKASKTSQYEQYARHVPGLGRFNEEAWTKQARQVGGTQNVSDEVVNDVFAELPVPVEGQSGDGKDWWRGLAAGRSVELSGFSDSSANGHAMQVEEQGSTDAEDKEGKVEDDDGDFQRQGTPPHLRRRGDPRTELAGSHEAQIHSPSQRQVPHRSQAVINAEDDDETDDEDDLDGPSQRSQRPRPPSQPQAPRRKVTPPFRSTPQKGTPRKPVFEVDTDDETEDDDLDAPSQPLQSPTKPTKPSSPARRSLSPPTSPAPSASKPPAKRLGTLGSRTRKSTPTPPKDPSPAPDSSPPLDPTPKPKKGKLGTLGGTRKPSSPPPQSTAHPSSPASAPKAKLGTLGGRKTRKETSPRPASPALSSTSNATPDRQPRATEKTVEPPAPRETSAERADAKRIALKRELEEKAKAPARKKRKF